MYIVSISQVTWQQPMCGAYINIYIYKIFSPLKNWCFFNHSYSAYSCFLLKPSAPDLQSFSFSLPTFQNRTTTKSSYFSGFYKFLPPHPRWAHVSTHELHWLLNYFARIITVIGSWFYCVSTAVGVLFFFFFGVQILLCPLNSTILKPKRGCRELRLFSANGWTGQR